MMKSEIRDSEFNLLSEKAHRLSYQKYLKKVSIGKLRAFQNEVITFDFPVTALIGPNGGGKTTILGASALLYISMQPRNFFTKSPQFDLEMKNWSITYEAIDRTINKTDIIRRTASFTSQKWYRDALIRNVLFFGVSRTLPAVERKDLSKFTNKNKAYPDGNITQLTKDAAESISRILGKDVSKYSFVKYSAVGTLSLLTGKNDKNETFSEFHFGAGESSIIKIVKTIEEAEDSSLILIEEIENGLHPVAIQRLVEYLVKTAIKKSAQVIFTTHSAYAINVLPPAAVWAALDGHLQQGKLDIMSLRTLVGEVSSDLDIFVEDIFAREWVLSMLRTDPNIAVDAISIYAMGGDGTAVKVHASHITDPSIKVKSICILDGDSKQTSSEKDSIFRLPGEAPESFVYDEILDRLKECKARLAVRLMHSADRQNEIEATIDQVRRSNIDHHLLYIQLGEQLSFLSEDVVVQAFLATWCEQSSEFVKTFLKSIYQYLPQNKK